GSPKWRGHSRALLRLHEPPRSIPNPCGERRRGYWCLPQSISTSFVAGTTYGFPTAPDELVVQTVAFDSRVTHHEGLRAARALLKHVPASCCDELTKRRGIARGQPLGLLQQRLWKVDSRLHMGSHTTRTGSLQTAQKVLDGGA